MRVFYGKNLVYKSSEEMIHFLSIWLIYNKFVFFFQKTNDLLKKLNESLTQFKEMV